MQTHKTTNLCVKFVVTKIERSVYRSKWLKVNVHLLLFALISDNSAAIYY